MKKLLLILMLTLCVNAEEIPVSYSVDTASTESIAGQAVKATVVAIAVPVVVVGFVVSVVVISPVILIKKITE